MNVVDSHHGGGFIGEGTVPGLGLQDTHARLEFRQAHHVAGAGLRCSEETEVSWIHVRAGGLDDFENLPRVIGEHVAAGSAVPLAAQRFQDCTDLLVELGIELYWREVHRSLVSPALAKHHHDVRCHGGGRRLVNLDR